MRRRPKNTGPSVPPLPLARYRGTSNREALAWTKAREEWWTATKDPDDGGWLPFLIEGWNQVGDLRFCGSSGVPCGDPDCLCNLPLELPEAPHT